MNETIEAFRRERIAAVEQAFAGAEQELEAAAAKGERAVRAVLQEVANRCEQEIILDGVPAGVAVITAG